MSHFCEWFIQEKVSFFHPHLCSYQTCLFQIAIDLRYSSWLNQTTIRYSRHMFEWNFVLLTKMSVNSVWLLLRICISINGICILEGCNSCFSGILLVVWTCSSIDQKFVSIYKCYRVIAFIQYIVNVLI